MTMELDMRAIKSFEESNEIRVLVTTQSEEENLSNNLATLNINYDIDARITISGYVLLLCMKNYFILLIFQFYIQKS